MRPADTIRPAIRRLCAGLVLSTLSALCAAQGPADDASRAARLWKSSIEAEARGALDEAQQAIYAFAGAGGDRYLAALRSGWLAFQRKDYDKAARFYKTAAEAAPNALTPKLGALYTARAAGRGNDALAACDAVLAVVPGHRDAALIGAELRLARGEAPRAVEMLRAALAEEPENAALLAAMAAALTAAGRAGEAAPLKARHAMLVAAGGAAR